MNCGAKRSDLYGTVILSEAKDLLSSTFQNTVVLSEAKDLLSSTFNNTVILSESNCFAKRISYEVERPY